MRKPVVPDATSTPSRSAAGASPPPTSSVAQVRLQAEELSELRDAMRLLDLTSMSQALREGIRLLTREAREVAAAEEIRRFYGGKPAPLPEGVTSATDEELAAADSEQW